MAQELVVPQHNQSGQRQFAPTLKAKFTTQGTLGTLIEALFETAHRPWTLDTMAQFSNQTPHSLSRHFKRGTEMSPIKFLEHVRVKLACDCLLSGMPMTRVLHTTGFGDPQRLNRAFHSVLGISAETYQHQFSPPNIKF